MQLPETVKYRGVRFEWGDTAVIVPPLRVTQAQKHSVMLLELDSLRNKAMAALRNGDISTEDMESYKRKEGEIIRMALRLNYPEMTEEEFEDIIDVHNSTLMYVAAMGLDQTSERVKRTGES